MRDEALGLMPVIPSPDHLRAVAPLVWGSLVGRDLTDDDRRLLDAGLGGIVLFVRNIDGPERLARLIRDARAAATGPLRVAVDQEGGHVVRLGEPLTRFPGPMGIAATGDPALAAAVARASATELAAVGVDVVLAPDLDLAVARRNPALGARTFGDDPERVARFGAAMVAGYLDGGVMPVAKHFPGHGRADADSHLDDPVVGADRSTLLESDLAPYRAAIAAGLPGLMLGHVRYDAIAPGVPASLAPEAVALARDDLAFDGLLVTDAIVMDAVAGHHPPEDAAVAALLAGNDVVMAIEAGRRVVDGLARAVADGRLPTERLADAHARVAAFDAAAGLLRPAPPDLARHADLAQEVARRSLTLVADDTHVLPLASDTRVAIVELASTRTSPIEDEMGSSDGAAELLAAAFTRPRVVAGPGGEILAPALTAAATASDVVVALTRDAFLSPESRSLLARLTEAGRPVVRIALRNPVDLELHPRPSVGIAAYADTPATIRALAAALVAGPTAFRGVLPLSTDVPEVCRSR